MKVTTRQEVFEALEPVKDPEHPVSVTDERMGIVKKEYIEVEDEKIRVDFKPTVPYCPMGGLIGVLIRNRLEEVYPDMDIEVRVLPGSHSQESAVNEMVSNDEKYENVLGQMRSRGMI
ncbi:MAG: iron-sulfur cluster assembly protein [Promethearchaeati archaeon]